MDKHILHDKIASMRVKLQLQSKENNTNMIVMYTDCTSVKDIDDY